MSKKAAKKTKTQTKNTARKTKQQAKKSKRAPSKARKPVRRRLAARTDIGILSSIPFASGSPYRDAFETALGATVADAVVRQNVGYDHAALDTALGQLNGTVSVTLIVTVGGVTPALRAAHAAQYGQLNKPFVSLVGSTLDPRLQPGAPQFHGAVDLQNVIYDQLRVDHLVRILHHDEGRICLLQNQASDLASDENNQLPLQATSIIPASIDENTNAQGVSDAFDAAFQAIGSSFDAVVISGDPYYTKNARVLVRKARDWTRTAPGQRRVVYPFVEYKAHSPENHTIHGPDLKSAFALLGDKVAKKRWGTNETVSQVTEDH
jgi:hypothetical protein